MWGGGGGLAGVGEGLVQGSPRGSCGREEGDNSALRSPSALRPRPGPNGSVCPVTLGGLPLLWSLTTHVGPLCGGGGAVKA